MMMRPLACALLVTLLKIPAAQLIPAGTTLSNAATCDFSLAQMWNRTQVLDAQCPGAPAECTVACGVALTSFMDSCGAFVDQLYVFDAADGVQDGQAGIFHDLERTCDAIPSSDILGELRPLWSSGECPDDLLEGAAATAVGQAECIDSLGDDSCRVMTTVMDCATDLCPTCAMAGACDAMCGFCVADGHAGHRLQGVGFDDHACPPGEFEAEVQAVDAACCDDGACAGVPTECDARCGVVFVDFFARCSEVLRVYNAADMTAFSQLDQTCATELPNGPLFRLLYQCTHGEEPQHEDEQPGAVATMIIVIGGYDGSGSRLSSGERFDPATNSWSPIASMGTARAYHAAAAIDGLLYAIGGDDGSSTWSSGERYDPASNAWSPIASMGTARRYHAAAAIDGLLYAIGGNDGSSWFSYLSSGERYDPASNTWSPIASMGTARAYYAAAAIDGLLYAIGGDDPDSYPILSSGERYDPASNTWSPIASMGTARGFYAAAAINGLLYAIGGSEGSSHLSSGERFDPATNTWSPIASMGTARDRHAAAAIDGLLYAIGGYDGSSIVSSGERFDPATNTWSPIASMGIVRGYHAAVAL